MDEQQKTQPKSRSDGARRSWESPAVRKRRSEGMKRSMTPARRAAIGRERREFWRKQREAEQRQGEETMQRNGARPYCRWLILNGETDEQKLLAAVTAKFPKFYRSDVRAQLRLTGRLGWTRRKGTPRGQKIPQA